MCNLQALTGCRKPTPGVSVRGKIIAASKVTAMPKTVKQLGDAANVATPGTYTQVLGDGVRYGETFALTTGAKWIEMEFVINSGELMAKLSGPDGFKAFDNELSAKFTGTNDQVREFVSELNECCGGWIMAIPTLDDPEVAAIIGTINAPCIFDMPKMTTAKKAGEESSAEIKFTDYSGKIWRSYPLSLGLPTV